MGRIHLQTQIKRNKQEKKTIKYVSQWRKMFEKEKEKERGTYWRFEMWCRQSKQKSGIERTFTLRCQQQLTQTWEMILNVTWSKRSKKRNKIRYQRKIISNKLRRNSVWKRRRETRRQLLSVLLLIPNTQKLHVSIYLFLVKHKLSFRFVSFERCKNKRGREQRKHTVDFSDSCKNKKAITLTEFHH
jgi:hypothetical protein